MNRLPTVCNHRYHTVRVLAAKASTRMSSSSSIVMSNDMAACIQTPHGNALHLPFTSIRNQPQANPNSTQNAIEQKKRTNRATDDCLINRRQMTAMAIRTYIGSPDIIVMLLHSYPVFLLHLILTPSIMDRVSHSAVPLPPHCRFECVTSVSKQGHIRKIHCRVHRISQ